MDDLLKDIDGNSIFNNYLKNSVTYLVVTAFILAFLLSACNSTNSESLSGDVVGNVLPLNKWGLEMENKKGIKVQIEGTSISDLTNKSGHYKLTGVKPGIYTLTFAKEGFGTMKLPFYQYAGGGEDFVLDGNEMVLGIIPDYTITLDSIYIDTVDKDIEAGGAVQADNIPDDGTVTIITYVSKNPEINPKDLSSYLGISILTSFANTMEAYSNLFNLHAFSPGDTLYFRSYPIAKASLFYLDPTGETYENIYCCLGKATQTEQYIVPDYNANMSFERTKNSFGVTVNRKGMIKTEFFRTSENASPADIAKLREKIIDFISK